MELRRFFKARSRRREYEPPYYLIDPKPKRRSLSLTGIAASAGILLSLVSVLGGLAVLYDRSKRADLDAELRLRISGFQIRLINRGNTTATKVNIDVVSWGVGAPGPMVTETYEIRDIPPRSDLVSHVELEHWPPPDDDLGRKTMNEHPKSGYFTVNCSNCSRAKTWAFHIPGWETDVFRAVFAYADLWPTAEVRDFNSKPEISQCVDVPAGVCPAEKDGGRWRSRWQSR
jgi:hypothetical protein